jgi:hypothetical protein
MNNVDIRGQLDETFNKLGCLTLSSVFRDALIRKTLLNGKDHGMFDLLILTSTDQLPLILKKLFFKLS